MSKTLKQVRAETANHFTRSIRSAGGLAELGTIDKKLYKYFIAGVIGEGDYIPLKARIMEKTVRIDLESN